MKTTCMNLATFWLFFSLTFGDWKHAKTLFFLFFSFFHFTFWRCISSKQRLVISRQTLTSSAFLYWHTVECNILQCPLAPILWSWAPLRCDHPAYTQNYGAEYFSLVLDSAGRILVWFFSRLVRWVLLLPIPSHTFMFVWYIDLVFILLGQIIGKKQSPNVWDIKRGSFCSQIEKTTFIITVSK
jgi:hypothetical protein